MKSEVLKAVMTGDCRNLLTNKKGMKIVVTFSVVLELNPHVLYTLLKQIKG